MAAGDDPDLTRARVTVRPASRRTELLQCRRPREPIPPVWATDSVWAGVCVRVLCAVAIR